MDGLVSNKPEQAWQLGWRLATEWPESLDLSEMPTGWCWYDVLDWIDWRSNDGPFQVKDGLKINLQSYCAFLEANFLHWLEEPRLS